MTRHCGTARKTAAILVIVVVVIAASGAYVLYLYETGQPPFCSGYPPGGNCPGSYSYAFPIAVNYTGEWKVTYYGYHGTGAVQNAFGASVNYTGGSLKGSGAGSFHVNLSGPNTSGLTLCADAERLDSSNSSLTLKVLYQTNETSIPHGSVSLCGGVIP